MMPLPDAPKVPVRYLADSFRSVTNSYKFYWLLSILEHIQSYPTQTVVPFNSLLARMVAFVWHPTNYFHLFFGKQDRLSQIALRLGTEDDIPANAKRQEVADAALTHLEHGSALGRELKSLSRYVPYRFLRPFFSQQLRGMPDHKIDKSITSLAELTFHTPGTPSFYRFVSSPKDGIEIHPHWVEYLHDHLKIVRGFCLWHLVKYVQRNNPNVPNIAAKLFEPGQRDLRLARVFWNLVYQQANPLQCIYSGQPVQRQGYSLDHFLPWRFVAHDLLWNLVPVSKKVNSAKGDCLPDLTAYFEPFAQLQYKAFQYVAASHRDRLLEDYTLLFTAASVGDVRSLSFDTFRQVLYGTIAPQLQIAQNMGFVTGWKYK